MFKTLLENNYVSELKEGAKETIKKDRTQHQNVIQFILEYVSNHKLLVSNTEILLNKQEYWSSVSIFALNVDEHAKTLIRGLCKKFDQMFFLKITNENYEYYIEYKLRKLCTLNSIKPYKSYSIYDFISPVVHKTDGINIFLLPYLIEIIYLYDKLYDPALASDWEDIYKDIKKMEISVDEEIVKLLNNESDPTKSVLNVEKKKCPTGKCQNVKNRMIEIKKMVLDYFKNSHYILCDEYYNFKEPKNAIEVISANVETDFKLLVNYLSKFINFGITYKKKSIYLPKYSQMEKYNFYMEIPLMKNIKKKHFLTIYNNTSYELINYYEKNQYKYADPIVQLKFAYLSVWSSNVVQKTHKIHHDEFIKFLMNKKNSIELLRKCVNIYELKKNYVGSYLPESIGKKLSLKFTGNKSNFYCHNFDNNED